MSSRSLLCLTLAISAVALGGCTADKKPPPRPAPVAPMALVAFDSCRQLRDDLRAATAASVGPYGFPGDMGLEAVAANGARTALDSGEATVPSAAGPAY